MQLELSHIRLDGDTQPRTTFAYDIVHEYAEDMEAGATFPPVIVFYDGTDYWLADGFHRIEAAKHINRSTIETDVREGTLQDAQWYSYGVNKEHGFRRSNPDKRHAVETALQHPYAIGKSTYEIAKHCGVSDEMVRQYKNRIYQNLVDTPITVTRNGSTYEMNTANIGGRPELSEDFNVEWADRDLPRVDLRQNYATPSRNGHPAPIPLTWIRIPASVEGAVLALSRAFTSDDLHRLIELLADRIAVDI